LDKILSISEKEFVQANLHANVSALALKLGRFPDMEARKILHQIAGYQVMEIKVPSWYGCSELIFPESLPLEQCSSEPAARYKARIADGIGAKSIADLTGGLGVDCAFLSQGREKVVYVERDADLCAIARHNFKSLGLNHIEVLNGNGPQVIRDLSYDMIYLDPSRRKPKGGKAVYLSDCEPDLTLIKSSLFTNAGYVLAKLSPMLDISMALRQLPETVEVHVVSVEGECKELLFLMKPDCADVDVRIHCVNISRNDVIQDFTFNRNDEQAAECLFTAIPGVFIYEPNASIMKAGAFSIITKLFDVRKLHPNSHLYTSDKFISGFPGRSFKVESFFTYHPKNIKLYLGGSTNANITVRNFPDTVAEIRKKTKLKDGGDVYVFATTLYDGRKVLISCRKP
jgi:hypothetical protein